jgi:hypothetical protein
MRASPGRDVQQAVEPVACALERDLRQPRRVRGVRGGLVHGHRIVAHCGRTRGCSRSGRVAAESRDDETQHGDERQQGASHARLRSCEVDPSGGLTPWH